METMMVQEEGLPAWRTWEDHTVPQTFYLIAPRGNGSLYWQVTPGLQNWNWQPPERQQEWQVVPDMELVVNLEHIGDATRVMSQGFVERVEVRSHIKKEDYPHIDWETFEEQFDLQVLMKAGRMPKEYIRHLCRTYRIDYQCLDLPIPSYCQDFIGGHV